MAQVGSLFQLFLTRCGLLIMDYRITHADTQVGVLTSCFFSAKFWFMAIDSW
jgi:hypothetical protein